MLLENIGARRLHGIVEKGIILITLYYIFNFFINKKKKKSSRRNFIQRPRIERNQANHRL